MKVSRSRDVPTGTVGPFNLRSDAFFVGRPGARPACGEVIEGVVTAARSSVDERRVRHLGYLLAEVAYSPDVDADLVGRALRMADVLSWRQLAFLAGAGIPILSFATPLSWPLSLAGPVVGAWYAIGIALAVYLVKRRKASLHALSMSTVDVETPLTAGT